MGEVLEAWGCRSGSKPRSRPAGWDVECWGGTLLPEVYHKPLRCMSLLRGGILCRHRYVPDLGELGPEGRSSSKDSWAGL